MKIAVVLFFVVLIYGTTAMSHSRGCIYILGRCSEECPEKTHAFVSSCTSPTWSERTCDNPEKTDLGPICDMSRCDCDEPLVKDLTTNQCVKLEDCPKKDENKPE